MTTRVKLVLLLWSTTITSLLQFGPVFAILSAPNIPYEAFVKPGDLNLGALYSARDRSGDVEQPCAGNITTFRFQQNIQAVAYIIDQINANSTILPNVTLGYVVLDDCRYSITALAKATRFLPVDDCAKRGCHQFDDANDNHTDNHPISAIRSQYDVFGVVGPTSSSKAVLISSLLGMFHIPVISPEATSDDLTDYFDHHYFLRVISPDRFQAEAMMTLIENFNWTYISVLYTAGNYGTNLFRQIQRATREKGICIGYNREISREYFTNKDFERIVKSLREHSNAKAVILVLDVEHAQGLMQAVKDAHAQGEFIWIGSEAFDERSFNNFEAEAAGALSLAVPLTYVKEFASHFLKLNPMNNPTNPWYRPLWENLFNCTWNSKLFDKKLPCHNFQNVSQVDGYYFSKWTSRTIDAVLVYAHALHQLIEDHCPEAVGNKTKLQDCVQGPLLLDYLHRVSFQGMSDYIEFDSNGDLLGNYEIKQVIQHGNSFEHRKIGTWQKRRNFIHFDKSVNWYLKGYENTTAADMLPDSVCSYPCELGQVAIQGELPCCWQCRTCRDNEIVLENISTCFECPYLKWPDPETFNFCLNIPPSYLHWSDLFGTILTALDALGLAIIICFTGMMINYQDRKIMKASSIPLSTIIICGLYLAFVTSLIFKAKPHTAICSISHVGYHISCTLIYATLFVKTSRIYRIFRASKKCRRPRILMDIRSQVSMIFMIIIIQVLLIFIVVVVNNIIKHPEKPLLESLIPSVAELHMPVRTTKFVELRCDRPKPVLLAPLCFNILLLLLCMAFAFLTRQLPDAFNESWYIFLSVTTTLIIWTAFIPTYFVAFYSHYKEALLSLALSLNSCFNLLCLFCPKMYALFFVEDDMIQMGFDDAASASRMSIKNLATRSSVYVTSNDQDKINKQDMINGKEQIPTNNVQRSNTSNGRKRVTIKADTDGSETVVRGQHMVADEDEHTKL